MESKLKSPSYGEEDLLKSRQRPRTLVVDTYGIQTVEVSDRPPSPPSSSSSRDLISVGRTRPKLPDFKINFTGNLQKRERTMASATVSPGLMITLALLLMTLLTTQTLPATKAVPFPRAQKVMVMMMVAVKVGAAGGTVMWRGGREVDAGRT